MIMKGKKFIKISDACGKLDSAIVESDKDVKNLMTRWKKKGLI